MNEYTKQSRDFLESCGVVLYAIKTVPQKAPRWAQDGKHGIQYSITLAKLKDRYTDTQYRTLENILYLSEKNIEFSFWGSIADKQKAEHGISKKPTSYDVLAGIYYPCDDFEDFCANFGYDSDSIQALETYKDVKVLNTKIESIFSTEELAKLSEII